MAAKAICFESGCSKPAICRGRCQYHDGRWRAGYAPWPTRAAPGAPIAFARKALEMETDDCILWPHGTCAKGSQWNYGVLFDPDTGEDIRAHRWVCTKAHGSAPEPSMQVRHLCHNTLCVNKRHLAWGTNKENVHDSVVDGRRSIGAHRPGALLTDDLVSQMRLSDDMDSEWAARIGVDAYTVGQARRGKTWKHVQTPPRKGVRPAGSKNPAAKLTECAVIEIRAALATGEKLKTLAEKFGVSGSTIALIRDGKKWRSTSASG